MELRAKELTFAYDADTACGGIFSNRLAISVRLDVPAYDALENTPESSRDPEKRRVVILATNEGKRILLDK